MKALRKQLTSIALHSEFFIISDQLLREAIFLALAGLAALTTLEALLPESVSDKLFFPFLIAGVAFLVVMHQYIAHQWEKIDPHTANAQNKLQSSFFSFFQSKTLRIVGILWAGALVGISLNGFPLVLIPILTITLLAITHRLYRELLA